MTLEELCEELAVKAGEAAECAQWAAIGARTESHVDDATSYAQAAGVYAERSRVCFDAARALCPSSRAAKDALVSASRAAKSYLSAKIAVAVMGARAGRLVALRG